MSKITDLLDIIDIENLVLLNSAVMPNDGAYTRVTIDKDEAEQFIKSAKNVVSFIGYDTTAKIIGDLFNVDVPVNRSMANLDEYIQDMQPFEGGGNTVKITYAVAIRLKKRVNPEEKGKIEIDPEKDLEFVFITYVPMNFFVPDKI